MNKQCINGFQRIQNRFKKIDILHCSYSKVLVFTSRAHRLHNLSEERFSIGSPTTTKIHVKWPFLIVNLRHLCKKIFAPSNLWKVNLPLVGSISVHFHPSIVICPQLKLSFWLFSRQKEIEQDWVALMSQLYWVEVEISWYELKKWNYPNFIRGLM